MMMHKKNLVVAIRTGGKILRESSDRVELPFGSEYEIVLKNLDTVRQQVNIQIDGGEDSGWIVLNPGEKQAIERFPRGNMNEGNRFKFIERTAKVESHRGVQAEDGLIRVEFKREKIASPIIWQYTNHSYSYPFYPTSNTTFGGLRGMTVNSSGRGTLGASRCGASGQSTNQVVHNGTVTGTATMDWAGPSSVNVSNVLTAQAITFDKDLEPNLKNEAGITVDGSISDQHFTSIANFDCEASDVLVLHLVGAIAGKPIKVAKTVKIKLECQTCGTKNKSIEKWCRECGTNLQRL